MEAYNAFLVGAIGLGALGIFLLAMEAAVGTGALLIAGMAFLVSGCVTFVLKLGYEYQVMLTGIALLLAYFGWRWYRKNKPDANSPVQGINDFSTALIGAELVVDAGIKNGKGQVQHGDLFYLVEGPDVNPGSKVKVVDRDGAALKVEPV